VGALKQKTTEDYKLPFSYRVKVWAYRNFPLVVLLTLANVLFGLFIVLVVILIKSSEIKMLVRGIEALSNKVIVVSTDGKVVEVQKAKVSTEVLKMAVRSVIEHYLMIDMLWFTNGKYDLRNYPYELNEETAFKINKLKSAWEELIDPAGRGDFKSFVLYLHAMGMQGRLPFSLKATSYNDKVVASLENKTYKNFQVYEYNGDIDVIAVFYVSKTGNWETTSSKISFKLEFYINPLEGTVNNPMGVKIINMQTSWVLLGGENEAR